MSQPRFRVIVTFKAGDKVTQQTRHAETLREAMSTMASEAGKPSVRCLELLTTVEVWRRTDDPGATFQST